MEQEDYLETIYKLQKERGHIRTSDIAEVLGVSKPSVSQMMKRLQQEECVIYEPYKPIQLTEKGKRIGRKIAKRHAVLAEFFTILGIKEKTQEKDIHGIEHYLSKETLKSIQKVNKFLKEKKYKNN